MRLIDGDALIAWIKDSQQMTSKMKAVIAKIKTMPPADRPQGEWREVTIVEAWNDRKKEYYPVNKKGFRCTNCGNLAPYGRKWKSCPYCEARMKGADDE